MSKTTVSLVLNSKGHISEQTRARVLRVCNELRYRPHPTARFLPSLRTSHRGRIQTGLFSFTALLSKVALSAYSDFLDGVAEVAAARGKMVVFQPMAVDGSHMVPSTNQLSFDARLLIGLVDDEQVERFRSEEVPTVVMGDHQCDKPIWNVNVDAYAAGQMAVNHLWQLGHRRLALVCQARECGYQTELRRGFEDALARKGVGADGFRILSTDTSSAEYFQSLPQQAGGRTAVVTITGGAAMHTLLKANEAGLEVPRDLSLLHFGPEERISSHTVLTRIDPVSKEVGRLAMELAIGLSEKGGQTPARTLLQPKLVEGETCRAL